MTEPITNWLDGEIKALGENKPAADYPESLKLVENKITEVEVDFSKPFEKKPNKMQPDKMQALIPVKVAGQARTFWLAVANPLYRQLCEAGKKGITKFKILRTGTQKNTRYSIIE